jgi:hypothetical protein
MNRYESLQDNILRVLDLSKTGMVTQYEVWDKLISLDLINIKNPYETKQLQKEFLNAFLSMPSTYNDIYLKIRDNVYFLSSDFQKTNFNIIEDENVNTKKAEELSFLKNDLIKVFTTYKYIPEDGIIDKDENTVLHYLAETHNCNLLKEVLSLKFNIDTERKNKYGKTVFDVSTSQCKNIICQHELKQIDTKYDELKRTIDGLCIDLQKLNSKSSFIKSITCEKYSNISLLSASIAGVTIGITVAYFFF